MERNGFGKDTRATVREEEGKMERNGFGKDTRATGERRRKKKQSGGKRERREIGRTTEICYQFREHSGEECVN